MDEDDCLSKAWLDKTGDGASNDIAVQEEGDSSTGMSLGGLDLTHSADSK